MSRSHSERQKRSGQSGKIGRTVLEDLRRGDFRRTLRRDMKDLYFFYIDEERRNRLADMGRLRRWILVSYWILKSMILRLTPVRRILLLLCIILFFYGSLAFRIENLQFDFQMSFFSFIILLIILMLELKDKLLAHDELEIGRTVQLSLLPKQNPTLPGWEIWLFTQPANDVGGDLVDYLALGADRLAIALGDVAGKGLGAALLMAKLQATLRAIATESGPLSGLGARLNQILYRDGLANRFASLVYIEMESRSGLLRILNAGHLPPIALKQTGIEKPSPIAPLLGILPEATYAEQKIDLHPGDLLFVYSDGLTEACDKTGEFFSDARLLEILPQLKGLSADAAGERLLAEVGRFIGEEKYNDDLSLIVLRRVS